jgi:hypothetical protein
MAEQLEWMRAWLNKHGIKNISVLNPPWTLKQLSEKSQFFKIEDSDIQ